MVGNLALANAMVKADVRMAFVNVTHSSADKIALKVSVHKIFIFRENNCHQSTHCSRF